MKKRYYIITAFTSYLVFLVATIPAKPVIDLIESPMVKITGVKGTLWNGYAESINIQRQHQLTSTQWSFNAWQLFTANVSADITTRYLNNDISSEVGTSFFGDLFVHNLQASLTAAQLSTLANIPIAQLDGFITADIQHANWTSGELPHATGTIVWKNASVTVADSANLGDITINLEDSDSDNLQAEIKNKGGDIIIDGVASLIPEQNYEVNIKLTPTATANRNIKQSLGLFAKKQNNGSYLLNNKGSLNQIGLL